MNLEYYRIFYYVAKYQNITQAAAALGNSQPNVTRLINNLEHELGCQLFLRSNRGVTLTPEGEQLYRYASAAMEQLLAGEAELFRQTSLESGTIYIGASETALHGLLLDELRVFHASYPQIHLKIMNYSTTQALNALKSGIIDLAVVSAPAIGDIWCQEVRLKQYRDILIGGTQFRALAERVLPLAEAVRYPLVCMEQNTTTYALYRAWYLSHGLTLSPDIEVATSDLVLPMVRNNLGLGFLPEEFVRDALEREEVVRIPLKEEIPLRFISLLYDEKRGMSVAAKKLRDQLEQKKK